MSFIFVGSTGVGKTELVKRLAQDMFNSPESLIRLDMSEFRAGGGACVGGHDDHRVLKVHVPALGVGNVAVVQNLEENIKTCGRRASPSATTRG